MNRIPEQTADDFLEPQLAIKAKGLTPDEMLQMAEVYERWSAQLRAKAGASDSKQKPSSQSLLKADLLMYGETYKALDKLSLSELGTLPGIWERRAQHIREIYAAKASVLLPTN